VKIEKVEEDKQNNIMNKISNKYGDNNKTNFPNMIENNRIMSIQDKKSSKYIS